MDYSKYNLKKRKGHGSNSLIGLLHKNIHSCANNRYRKKDGTIGNGPHKYAVIDGVSKCEQCEVPKTRVNAELMKLQKEIDRQNGRSNLDSGKH